MAIQVGPHPFRGTIGNVTGYIRQGKYHIRRKSGITVEQMRSNPRNQNTFLNAFDMRTAISGGKLIRQDLRQFLLKGKDSQHHNRISGILRLALNSDLINGRGHRSLQNCSLSALKGYNFNLTGLLNSCFKSTYKTLIDRNSGIARLSVPSFVPNRHLKLGGGATHFEIISVASEIDFQSSVNLTSIKKSEMLPIDSNDTKPFLFEHRINKKTHNQVLLMMGVRYYREINGKFLQVTDRQFCPLSIVDVSTINGIGGKNETTEMLEIKLQLMTNNQKKLLDKLMDKMITKIIENHDHG